MMLNLSLFLSLGEYVLLRVESLTDTDVNGWEEVIPTGLG